MSQIRLHLDDPIETPVPLEGNLTYAVDLGDSISADMRYCAEKTGERDLPQIDRPYSLLKR